MKFKNLELKRLTVHKIYGKSDYNATPYAEDCIDFCKLGPDGNETLHSRISASIAHKSKFFELDMDDSGKDSFFEIQKGLWGSRKDSFIKTSKKIADKAAAAHERKNLPDGLLMVIEALIDGKKTIIVVKAEKSDAFSMAGSDLQLIKDIFLSSDKTLYKLGFFIKKDDANSDLTSYGYYVYDDSFAPSKDDLAHYFYSKFLGLSTEKNSKIQTNKLHKHLTNFATDHVDLRDRMDVLRNIDRAFMDNNKKTMSPSDFKTLFPNELDALFDTNIVQEFPRAFVRDTAIVNGLKTKRIAISQSTTLLLKNNPKGLLIGNTGNEEERTKLRTVLDSGTKYNYVVIPTSFDKAPEVEE